MPDRKTLIITGATGGLGHLAAIEFARQGYRLGLTARSPERAESAVARIRSIVPTAEIDVFRGDLSLVADAQRIGAELNDRYDRIDVLVNNAGLHAFEQRITSEGLPEMVAVNYLAPWILSNAILPRLASAPAARVVTVASEASRRHGILSLPDDLTATAPFGARESSALYGKTKLLDIMFSLELASRLEATAITANCLDPGFNVTGLGRELAFAAPLEAVLRTLHIGDPARGAGLIVTLATDPALEAQTGAYYTVKGTRRVNPASPADDPELRAQLWGWTEALVDRLG